MAKKMTYQLARFLSKISWIEIIVFISGTVVMVLELIGSRVLAPYVGTSIFVWAALIGIILGALSIGYYIGGQISKKNPSLDILTLILLTAGILVLFIPIIKSYVLGLAATVGVKFGSIFATTILFFLPNVVLGMVSPYAIRLKMTSIDDSGGTAGNLYAISTVGSIVGTFLAGFYLIPSFGTLSILFSLSTILIITSLIGPYRLWKLMCLLAVVTLWLFLAHLPTGVVYEGDTAYNHIRVQDTTDIASGRQVRILFLATEMHSIAYLDSTDIYADYQKVYTLDSIFKPTISSALTLGGGAYVSPINFLERYPHATMTVAEIDPKVTDIAQRYFHLKPDPRLQIVHEDARLFLNNNQNHYDVIYGDTFASYYSLPFQLTTVETMERIHQSLTDDGLFMVNIISALDGPRSLFFKAEYKTLLRVFPTVYIFPTTYTTATDSTKDQNIVLVATNQPRITEAEMMAQAHTDMQRNFIPHIWSAPVDTAGIPLLTDDFAPVDFYISKLL